MTRRPVGSLSTEKSTRAREPLSNWPNQGGRLRGSPLIRTSSHKPLIHHENQLTTSFSCPLLSLAVTLVGAGVSVAKSERNLCTTYRNYVNAFTDRSVSGTTAVPISFKDMCSQLAWVVEGCFHAYPWGRWRFPGRGEQYCSLVSISFRVSIFRPALAARCAFRR
jgi:hypothetical protein